MISARFDPARRPRGIAQIEFVANMPLMLGLLGLVIWIGAVLLARSGRTIIERDRLLPPAATASTAQPTQLEPSTVPAAPDQAGPADRSDAKSTGPVFDPRPPLQVPPRFAVSGEERVGEVLRPITELGRPTSAPIPAKPRKNTQTVARP
jgi:hypothetical protein